MNFQSFRKKYSRCDLDLQDIKKKIKKRSGKCSPLPTYQISFKYLQPFLRNRSVTMLILDKEEKFLLASALSAIFKLNQNNKKTVWQIFPSTHLPSFIQISSAVPEKQVRDARPHARTRVKIISCHSFA
jgi:hypothetical protein